MDSRLRTWLISLTACILAVWVGISLAQEEHFLASVAALLLVWAVLAWMRGPLAEAWLLGFLFFGYVIGNRGFAQITPISGLPLFLSELGLGVVVTLVLLRGAQSRGVPLRLDWLNGLLLLWLTIGSGRIVWDVRIHGLTALRDFATVYYVLFFFAMQALAAHAASRRLFQETLLFTFGLLPFTALLASLFPDFFRTNLLIAGVPLIFYKEDLLATFLFAGFIYLVPKNGIGRWWLWPLALTSLCLGFAQLSRAGLVGLGVALVGLGIARRWQPMRVVLLTTLVGLLTMVVYSLLQQKDFTQTKAYALYEHVTSIADFEGKAHYRNDESVDSGDNNRFRLVWWQTVTEETLTTSPIFGLGFGYDLARGFVTAYNPLMGNDFTARSPHSIIFTTLGRMGLLGLTVLLVSFVTLARLSVELARQARTDHGKENPLTLHAMCWVILVSSCFGVVLEGPMGAIPFWIMLGLAHHDATRTEPT